MADGANHNRRLNRVSLNPEISIKETNKGQSHTLIIVVQVVVQQ